MIPIYLGCKKIVPEAIKPELATLKAACFDLSVCFHKDYVKINGGKKIDIDEDGIGKHVHLHPGSVIRIPTGLIFVIPTGYQMKINPRSGYAWKNKITVINSPGTIDEDYIFETFILLHNSSTSESFRIDDKMRIAQAELVPNLSADIMIYEAEEKDIEGKRTDRTGGLGSTG